MATPFKKQTHRLFYLILGLWFSFSLPLLGQQKLSRCTDAELDSLERIARIYDSLENFTGLESVFLKLRQKATALCDTHSIKYFKSLHYGFSISSNTANTTEMQRYVEEMMRLVKPEEDTLYVEALNDLGVLYVYMGNFAMADTVFQRVIILSKQYKILESYLNGISYKIQTKLFQLKYAEILPLINEGELLIQSHFHLDPNIVANFKLSKALFGTQTGQYDGANKICLEIVQKLSSRYANYWVAKSLILEILVDGKNKCDEALQKYKVDIEQLKQTNIKENSGVYMLYANVHNNILICLKNDTAAIKEKIASMRHCLETPNSDLLGGACLIGLGSLYKSIGLLDSALFCYNTFLTLKIESQSPLYKMSVRAAKAGLLMKKGDKTEAYQDLLYFRDLTRIIIRQTIFYMSQEEQIQFYTEHIGGSQRFSSFVLSETSAIPPQTKPYAVLYNSVLEYKSFLLRGQQTYLERLRQSSDSTVVIQNEEWIKLLAQESQTIPNTPRSDSIKQRINRLERQLAARSQIFNSVIDTTGLDWTEIRTSLAKHEAAIEIIEYRKIDYQKSRFTDSTGYAALIITPQTIEQPIVVHLPQGDSLSTKGLAKWKELIDKTYGAHDPTLYKMFWQPITDVLREQKINRVYLSADGIYQKVNLDVMPLPQKNNLNKKDFRFIMDEWDIIPVNSTRDVRRLKREKPTDFAAIIKRGQQSVLVGDPVFSHPIKKQNIPVESLNNNGAEQIDVQEIGRKNRGYLERLAFSKTEVEGIYKLCIDFGLKVETYMGEMATEGLVKSLIRPFLLLLSTHAEVKADTSKSPYSNPLLQSIIYFTGASDKLPDVDDKGNLIENGKLTANEAQSLRLDSTELVILSACETGLGEIGNGEGVYGLKRALTIAGVRQMLLSLAQVDDESTSEFTTTFIRNWLKHGDSHKAYRETQLAMRKRYAQKPYHWGLFVHVRNGR